MNMLDDTQRRVVDHDGGPLLVLGSPGTGKTTVLVERWVRLASEGHPHRVLLLVTKRERALALRDELPWRLDVPAVIEAPVHTWHALAFHLVSRYYRKLGYGQPPVLLNTNEQWTATADLLATEDPGAWKGFGDHLRTRAFTNEVADFCVRAGHRGLSDDDLVELARRQPQHEAVARFAIRYREHLRAVNWLDYAELIGVATRLVTEDGDIRASVHRRFEHVLVDDAHELAPVQLHLLSRLNTENLVCAGDPDSAIEAFRGADPGWLDRFSQVVKGHERVILPTCHRFGTAVATVATELISRDEHADHRWTHISGPEGSAEVRCYATMAAEIEAAAREIRSAHLLDDVPYDEMAVVLAQPATYTHALKRVLDSLEVPYRLDSGDRPLQLEPAVRAVLDLCRLALHPPTEEDERANLTKAVLGSALVGASPQQLRRLERESFKHDTSILDVVAEDAGEVATAYRRLVDVARHDPTESADATFARVFEASDWITALVASRSTDHIAAHQVDALIAQSDALAHFVERRPGATMRDYLATSAEGGFAVDTWEGTEAREGVHVLSFHAAKGLEWDVVCILGVAEGLIPKAHRSHGLFDPWALEAGSERERALAQLAEERRTFYVALTRPRRRLVVSSSPGTRRATPSRFITEAFGAIPDIIVGDEDRSPLTLAEAAALHRRTLARAGEPEHERAAAAAALAHIPDIDLDSWWWTRDFTPGAPLRPDGKLTTSYSRIGNYDNCPLQYVLLSVLGLDPASTYQMKFGSLVHNLIERSDPKYGDIQTLEEAIAIYRERFDSEHKHDYPNIKFARTYFSAGVRMLKLWWSSERHRGETVAVEYTFNDLDIDGHTIRGRIDRVAKTRQGLVLTDYKTSRSAATYDEAATSLQLAIYYRAAQVYDDLVTQGEPHRMQLVYPGIERRDRDDGSLYCDRRVQKPEQAEAAISKLRTYLADAAAERFAPSPEANCRWCNMKVLCPRWPEGMEVPR